MPHKRINKLTFWTCNTCGRDFSSRTQALECEKQVPKKLLLTRGGTKTDYWEKGDMLLVYSSRDEKEWVLGIIKDTKIDGHYIVPIIETLDSPAQPYSSWSHRTLYLLDDDIKRKLRTWLDVIDSNPDKVS